jgi:hypothetical protein
MRDDHDGRAARMLDFVGTQEAAGRRTQTER